MFGNNWNDEIAKIWDEKAFVIPRNNISWDYFFSPMTSITGIHEVYESEIKQQGGHVIYINWDQSFEIVEKRSDNWIMLANEDFLLKIKASWLKKEN